MIEELKKEALTDTDLLDYVDSKIVEYPTLEYIDDIDDLFLEDSCILFIPNTSRNNIGHWVCLIKHDKTIEYFDSYGREPDPQSYLKGSYPFLSNLLYNSNYRLIYNNIKLQGKGTNTCGRHVIVRILLKKYPLSVFYKVLKNFNNNIDDLVTWITDKV